MCVGGAYTALLESEEIILKPGVFKDPKRGKLNLPAFAIPG
jgi:hypothetical protein